MAFASSGEATGISIGRVASRASVSIEWTRFPENVSQVFQSGRYASMHFMEAKVANASLSQIPFHHFIVTRSPNHM